MFNNLGFQPLGPKPVVQAHPLAKIIIIGQAPGTKVHQTGIPWNDPSGNRLRQWLNVDKSQFYNPENFALVPMGFCYPGKGKSGDLPPRPECAPQWHSPLINMMPNLDLFLLFGQYAQRYYLGKQMKKNLTENVRAYHEFLPQYLPMPHPSPRNIRWFKQNDWFEAKLLPVLRERVNKLIK